MIRTVVATILFFMLWTYPPCARGQLIDVTKAGDSLITDVRIDQILNQDNSSVQIESGPGTCLLTLHRDNPAPAVSGDVINGSDDFDSICGQPGYVHVVDQINWCGITSPNVIGCSQTPGQCVVVMRYQEDLEWILWMHEYSHSKGLHHRDDPRALMAPVVDASHDSLTGLECATVQNTASTGVPGPPMASQPGDKTNITEFIKRTYFEGTPYAEARRFKKRDVDKLISMLKDPGMKHYLTNITTTLGMIGKARATNPLIDFVSGPPEIADIEIIRARKSAVIALGYVVNTSNDPKAMNFLLDATSTDTWKRRTPAISPKVAEQLTSSAILGLALTGKPLAHEKLALIMSENITPETAARIKTAQQALREHEKIVILGIRKYSSKHNQ